MSCETSQVFKGMLDRPSWLGTEHLSDPLQTSLRRHVGTVLHFNGLPRESGRLDNLFESDESDLR